LDTAAESLRRFRAALDAHDLLRGVRRLVVGCSGGADSTALLRLFAATCDALGGAAPEVFVGHVHHGIRGADADADEQFVAALAAQLGCRFLVERASVPAIAEARGLSIESAAREVRYDAFRHWAREHELDAVALGHHRDDAYETLVLRICRGTGVSGLAGIPATRELGGCDRPVRVIRPLLAFSRQELRDGLRALGQSHRHDASNDALDAARNRVRHEVLPLLESRVHPGVRASLERLARQADDLRRDLDELGKRALRAARRESPPNVECGGVVELDVDALREWPPSVRREVARLAADELRAGAAPLSARTFDALDALVTESSDSDAPSVELAGGLRVERRYGALRFVEAGPASLVVPAPIELPIDGSEVRWGDWALTATRGRYTGGDRGALEEWIDATRVGGGSLQVRARRHGDTFHPLGAPGHKKLKEFYREQRVAPEARAGIPLVTCGDEIVWVVGQRLAHAFRLRIEGGSAIDAVRLRARTCGSRDAGDCV